MNFNEYSTPYIYQINRWFDLFGNHKDPHGIYLYIVLTFENNMQLKNGW
jgi:hypothetical protein